MISKELVKKIRYIQIYTNKKVNDILAGEYESAFKGRGMEFDEVREYQPGDEVRTIDWNVTARMGKPYVKRFVEERELTIMFLVDLSASGTFGSTEKTKNTIAAEITALLSFCAVKNNDKIGLVIFTDDVEMFIPPKKGITHVLRIVRELLYFKPEKVDTNISVGLDYLGKVMKKQSVLFLISDFQESDFQKSMRIMSKRHDLIAVPIIDPRELSFPDVGLLVLNDAETGEIVTIDTGSLAKRGNYKKLSNKNVDENSKFFASIGVDEIKIETDKDYVQNIVKFFLAREKRR